MIVSIRSNYLIVYSANKEGATVIWLIAAATAVVVVVSSLPFSFKVCQHCKANYNVETIKEGPYDMPALLPKKEGICDHVGVRICDDVLSLIVVKHTQRGDGVCL